MFKMSKRAAAFALGFTMLFTSPVLPVKMTEDAVCAAEDTDGIFEDFSQVPDGPQVFEVNTTYWNRRKVIGRLNGFCYGEKDVSVADASSLDSGRTGKTLIHNLVGEYDSVDYNINVKTPMEKGDIFTISYDYYEDTHIDNHKLQLNLNQLYGDDYALARTDFSYESLMRSDSSSKTNILMKLQRCLYPFNCSVGYQIGPQKDGFARYDIVINTCDKEADDRQTVTYYRDGEILEKGVFYEYGKTEPLSEINGVVINLEHLTKDGGSVMALSNIYMQKTSIANGRQTGVFAAMNTDEVYHTYGGGSVDVSGGAVSFSTQNAEDTAVMYRSFVREDGSGAININSIKDEAYLTADVSLGAGASAEDYYMVLASRPKGENGTGASASGVRLSEYLKNGKVKIPLSAFDEMSFANEDDSYTKLDGMLVAGAGIAFAPGAQKTGSVTIGNMYISGDVEGPSDFVMTNMSDGAITVSWTPGKNTVAEYQLYRGNELIASLPDGTDSFTDSGLINDKTYTYRLRTKTMFDTYTNDLVLRDIYLSAVGKPSDLNVENIGGESLSVKLTWDEAEYGTPSGYVIYRDGKKIAETESRVREYTDSAELSENREYEYEVRSKAADGTTSYGQIRTVMAAYTYPPENPELDIEQGKLTWDADSAAASYEIYLNDEYAANAQTKEYVFDESFEYNKIYKFYIVALTAGGKRSLPSETKYAYMFNPALKRGKTFYSERLGDEFQGKGENANADFANTENVIMGENSAKLTFSPLYKNTYTISSGNPIGADKMMAAGRIIFAAYVPQDTDLSKLSVGFSYTPQGKNSSILVAAVPLTDYVTEKDVWTIVEIPVSELPKRATYIKNAQDYTIDVDWGKVTGITFVREASAGEKQDVIYIDEVFSGTYDAQTATAVKADGTELGGASKLETNAEYFSLQTSVGFNKNALHDGVISLKNAADEDVLSVINTDKSGRINITPLVPLAADTEYTLKFEGIKDKNGAVVSGSCVFGTNSDIPAEKGDKKLEILDIAADSASVGSVLKAVVSAKEFIISPAEIDGCEIVIQYDPEMLSITQKNTEVEGSESSVAISRGKVTVKSDKLTAASRLITAKFEALKSGSSEIAVSGKFTSHGVEIGMCETKAAVNIKSAHTSAGSSTNNGGKTSGYGGGRDTAKIPDNNTNTTPNTGNKDVISQALRFTDIPHEYWAYDVINDLAGEKIINGYEDGSFRPENPVTREEFAALLTSLLGLKAENPSEFTDVAADGWYADAISAASANGIIRGKGDGVFGVGEPISREDMCVMIHRMTEKFSFGLKKDYNTIVFSDENEIADYAEDMVYALQKGGIVNGYEDGSFRPTASVTRAEAAKVISSLLPYAASVRAEKASDSEPRDTANTANTRVSVSAADKAYDRARSRLKAFSITVPQNGDGDASYDDFMCGLAEAFGAEPTPAAGRIWAVSTGIAGEDEYRGSEPITYGTALEAILKAAGLELVVEGKGGGENGIFMTAKLLDLTKGISAGMNDNLSGRDACLLLSNLLDAEAISNTFAENSVSLSGRTTVLEQFLEIKKKAVTVAGISKKDRQITVTEDGREIIYNTIPGFNFDSVAPAACTIYVNKEGLLCYCEITSGDTEVIYDYIESVNGNDDKEAFYYQGGVSEMELANGERAYKVSSDAVFVCNEKSLGSGEAFQLTDCFVRAIAVHNTIVYADVYKLTEGGLISAATDKLIKFTRGDINDNSLRDLDEIENITVVLDGGRVGGMELLKDKMVFDYWLDENKDNLVIAASSRSAYGSFTSYSKDEIRINDTKYLTSDDTCFYNTYLKRYETDGDAYRNYLGQLVYAYLDDRSEVRYLTPDDEGSEVKEIYGVVTGVKQTGVFSKDSEIRFIPIYGTGTGNDEMTYPVRERLSEDSLSVDYVKGVQKNLDGKGFLKFTINGKDEISKIELPENFGRSVVLNCNEYSFDEEKYYFGGLYLRYATVFALYEDEDGFAVATTDYTKLRTMNMDDKNGDIYLTVDYDPRDNPLPKFAMLTGRVDKLYEENEIWDAMVNDIAYTEEGCDVTFGSSKYHLSEEFVKNNNINISSMIAARIYPYAEQKIVVRKNVDLSGPLDSWKDVLEETYGAYSNEKTSGMFEADKLLLCTNECLQFEVDGNPTDVLGLGDIFTVYEITERGGSRKITTASSGISGGLWFQTKQALGNIEPTDRVWFSIGTDNGYRHVSRVFYYKN